MAARQLSFTLNGLTYRAQAWGDERGQPVLALHGWLDNSATFARLAPLLQGVYVLALDMAGQGRSDHRPGACLYNLWDDIQDVLALCDQLGWQKPWLMGHSRGAIIAALTAATFPDKFGAVALIEGFMPETQAPEQAPEQLRKSLQTLASLQQKKRSIYPTMDAAVQARARSLFPLSEGAARLLAERGVAPVDGGFSWLSDIRLQAPGALRITREHAHQWAQQLQLPNLLLLADAGLPALYPGYLAFLQQHQHIHYALLQGGHHLHLEEQHGEVAARLNHFFAGLLV